MNWGKMALMFSFIVCFNTISAQESYMLEEWRNPVISGVNREPAHSTSLPLNESNVNLPSPWIKNLNGKWKFHFARNLDEAPSIFYQEKFDASAWDDINVPASWQLQGYDFPIYVYSRYCFPDNPPHVPSSYNPVGSYLKYFDVPKSWNDRQVFICLKGVTSAFYLWMNGEYVGYSEGGKLPVDFDITSHVKRGMNILAVQVLRWTDASYLEKYNSWNLSGIERDVMLYSTPKLHMRDHFFKTKWNSDYSEATLQSEIEIVNYSHRSSSEHVFYIEMVSEENKVVAKHEEPVEPINGDKTTLLKFDIKIENPQKWSDETPYLYRINFGIKKGDKWTERNSIHYGLREVKVQKGKLLVNGKPIQVLGVNKVEFSPIGGGYVTEKEMLAEIILMKQHNINTIRTNGFPFDERWYKLCDEYGLYVVDEANINVLYSRGKNNKSVVLNKKWEPVFVDRVSRMVERDKNYACVIMWSLGSESDDGSNFISAYNWIKQRDNTRPVFYDNATENYYMANHSDVDVWPDARFDQLKLFDKVLRKRPLLIGQMGHMYGNASGNLLEYMKWVKKENQIQGGFVDKWKDKAIKSTNDLGNKFWAYGGEFGPSHVPSDGRYCLNGVIGPNGEITPELIEVKKLFQKLDFSWKDEEKRLLQIKNNHRFINLEQYFLKWELHEDGKIISENIIDDFSIDPMSSQVINLDIDPFQIEKGGEYWVYIQVGLKEQCNWGAKGHVIAYDLLRLNIDSGEKIITKLPGKIRVKESDEGITVKGKDFEIEFKGGRMYSYLSGDVKLLADGGGPMVNVYRAPIDNEYKLGQIWKKYRLDRLTREAISTEVIAETKDIVNIKTVNKYSGNEGVTFKHTCVFSICSNGFVRMENEIIPEGTLPDLAKVGVFLTLPEELTRISWYGRGPHENYPDRKESALVGEYEMDVKKMFEEYVHPQDYGSRQDARWVACLNKNKRGLFIKMVDHMAFKASNFRGWQLDDVDHIHQLPKVDRVFLEINAFERGLGDYVTGVMPAYEFEKKSYKFEIIMSAVVGEDDDLHEHGHDLIPKMQ